MSTIKIDGARQDTSSDSLKGKRRKKFLHLKMCKVMIIKSNHKSRLVTSEWHSLHKRIRFKTTVEKKTTLISPKSQWQT